MFETGPPAGGELDAATLTLWGDALLVTYSQRAPPRRLPEKQAVDDFDQPVCRAQPRTFVELRDAATGALLGSAVLDTSVITAAVLQGDRMLIGGASRDPGR